MQHVALQIIRGVFTVDPSLGVNRSQELPIQSIDLLNAGGFSVGDDGWIPGIPGIKNGGIRIDNPLATGSAILGAVDGNVTETMRLNATEADKDLRYALMSKLSLFRQYVLDFQTGTDIQPVYLLWYAPGAPGAQYAVIVNMEIAGESDPFAAGNYESLTITIEREPYWRSIPPGVANNTPFEYPSVMGTVANYTLQSRDNEGLAVNDCQVSYIDIPAEDIPGDAPALVQIRFNNVYMPNATPAYTRAITSVMISRYTRRTKYEYRPDPFSGVNQKLVHTNTLLATRTTTVMFNILNPYLINYETGVAAVADTGARGRKDACADANLTTAAEISFSSTSDLRRIQWIIDPTVMNGTYAVFLRGGQRGGALGDTRMYLKYGFFADDAQTEPTRPELTPSAPTEHWPVNYMGTVSIPTGARRVITGDYGVLANPYIHVPNFYIELWASRSAGTSTLRVQDLVLMPIDECSVTILANLQAAQLESAVFYDNTGIGLHGSIGELAYADTGAPELQGSMVTLQPGVNNRLYFFWQTSNRYSGSSFVTPTKGFSSVAYLPTGTPPPPVPAASDAIFNVDVAYVPRWRGVRSV